MANAGEKKRPGPANSAGSPKRANISWAWLYNNKTFADAKIVLVQEGKAPQGAEEPCAVLLPLPAHRVVLASASSYFRERLVSWDEQQKGGTQQAPDVINDSPAPQADTSSPTQSPGAAVLEEAIQADQLPAAEAVLQFMYTQELTKQLDASALVTVIRLAERWDVQLCTLACLQRLSGLTLADLPDTLISQLMADDLPKAVTDQPLYHPLLEACKQRLVQQWGTVQAVIADDVLRASFCTLSFSALKLWARLDDLKVDNEDSVAVLISHWWEAQHKGVKGVKEAGGGGGVNTAAQVKDQARQLSCLLRLNQLSASFFTGVLNQLPWFSPPPEPFNILTMSRALHPPTKGTALQQGIKDKLPPAWLAKSRTHDAAQVVTHQWVVSEQELQLLHQEAQSSRVLRESPGLYWCGYMWHLCVSLNSHKEALWVGVRARSALPAAYSPPVLLGAKFTLSCKEASSMAYTRKETLNFGDGAALQPSNCNGTPRLLQVPASTAPRTASLPPANLMPDGKLHLQLTMEAMQ